MSTAVSALRFSPDVPPDHGDIVMLHLLDFISGKAEIHQAQCDEDGEWHSVSTGQVFGYGKRDKVLMGWTPNSEQQLSKYAQRR
jgi:hypothetical protein